MAIIGARRKTEGLFGEAHERLKVGTVKTLNCYSAHGEENPTFQRTYEHIVLVHYRETSEVTLHNLILDKHDNSTLSY
ncbi:calmodulin-binding transcription activator 4-like [Arachis stenosperma]|uniref:calmodulin-binding transcription activator 4-like n=1 Tax=Arachis stenosperma TaxID=217475 RepID=UPI0025AC708E|nr:calmodulin-binding transcription activator 4-like [Arachis stenosperma]